MDIFISFFRAEIKSPGPEKKISAYLYFILFGKDEKDPRAGKKTSSLETLLLESVRSNKIYVCVFIGYGTLDLEPESRKPALLGLFGSAP